MAEVAFGILGLIGILYYLVIVLYAGITADFAWIWLVGGLFLLGMGRIFCWARLCPGVFWKNIRNALCLVLAICLFCFLLLLGKVVSGMYAREREGLSCVVVLGAQVKGRVPSRALKKRLDRAVLYGEKNPETQFILSGGQGPGEEISEARCMADYMTKKGISASRLILEERSATTQENLRFSRQLTGCGEEETGILSNNFHIYRALRLAERQGYQRPCGLPAPSDPIMQAHYVVREVFALVKERLVGNL